MIFAILTSKIFLDLFQIIYINSHPFLNGLFLQITLKSLLFSTITIIIVSIFIILICYRKISKKVYILEN